MAGLTEAPSHGEGKEMEWGGEQENEVAILTNTDEDHLLVGTAVQLIHPESSQNTLSSGAVGHETLQTEP